MGCVKSSYLSRLLQQHLIVLAESHAKDDGCDSFEAMDPLFSLGSLSTNVKHTICRRSKKWSEKS